MERSLQRALVFAARIIPLLLTIFSLQCIPAVLSAPPVSVAGAGYVTVNGILYVQGGYYNEVNTTSAFSSLNLKTAWNDTSPPWKSINIDKIFPIVNTMQSIAATPDKTRLVFWGGFSTVNNATLIIYNIPSSNWSSLTIAPSAVPSGDGVTALIDPTTPGGGLGNLFVPNGCRDTANLLTMCELATDTKALTVLNMPGGLVPNLLQYYSFVYCTSRKSMMLYGGVGNNTASNPNLYEFSPSTSAWSLLQPQGAPPGDLQRHCMVETSDGSKMLVFGGMSVTQQATSRLFILYIANMTWVEGPDVGSANARVNHVCATNGDSFIVWGGLAVQNSLVTILNNTPLIYNIRNNTWVRNFEVAPPAPPKPTATATTTTAGSISPSDVPAPTSKKSVAGAVGGAIGGIVAVTAIGFFFFRWRKRRSESDGGGRHSQLKRSSNGGSAGLKKKGKFFGKSDSNKEDKDERDAYTNYPATRVVQLQDTPVQNTVDPYVPASSAFVQSQSSSPPLPPLLQQLPPRPETQNRNTLLSYTSSPRDTLSGIEMMNRTMVPLSEQESPQFSRVSSSPPPIAPIPSQPRQSVMSSSPTGSPQREDGTLSFSPVDPYGQSMYYDTTKSGLSAAIPLSPVDPYGQPMYYDTNKSSLSALSPQGTLGAFPVDSQGRSSYLDGRNSVLSDTFKSQDSRAGSTAYGQSPQYIPIGSEGPGIRLDPRSPQQVGPGHETSPAAWMAAARTRESFSNPQAIINPGMEGSSSNNNEIGSGGAYYPPPPGQLQSPAQPESDLMQKRLRLLKAQHELDLEKMRLEQEAQLQVVQKQFFQGGGG